MKLTIELDLEYPQHCTIGRVFAALQTTIDAVKAHMPADRDFREVLAQYPDEAYAVLSEATDPHFTASDNNINTRFVLQRADFDKKSYAYEQAERLGDKSDLKMEHYTVRAPR